MYSMVCQKYHNRSYQKQKYDHLRVGILIVNGYNELVIEMIIHISFDYIVIIIVFLMELSSVFSKDEKGE